MTSENEMAYPCQSRWDAGNESMDLYPDQRGLTKREYFSAMAMQGLQELITEIGESSTVFNVVARNSVQYADALIAELNKETK